MKRSGSKVLFLLMFLLILGVSQFLNIDFIQNIKMISDNLFTFKLYDSKVLLYENISANTFMAGDDALPTEVGEYETPVKLYVTNQYNVYSTKSTNGNALFKLEKCSEIDVYAVEKNNGMGMIFGGNQNIWYKISDIANFYVRYSDSYLSTTQPESCTSVVTTTRPNPTFEASTNATPQEGYDLMYSNKLGTILVSIDNIKYLKESEKTGFALNISKNGEDVTDKFNISTALPKSDGSVEFEINMKSETDYSKGNYIVTVLYDSVSTTTSFTLVDKYYSFDVEFVGDPSHGYNIPYTWEIKLVNVENIVKKDINVVVKDAAGKTSKYFEIEETTDGFAVTTLSNLKKESQGKYRIVVSYEDKIGNNSRPGGIEYNYEIELVKNAVEARRDELLMHRYRYYTEQTNYSISISRIEKIPFNNNSYIEYNDGTEKREISFETFRKQYTSLRFNDSSFENHLDDLEYTFLYDKEGRIVYRYSDIMIYNLKDDKTISYYSINGNSVSNNPNVSIEEFEKNYSGALDIIKNNSSYNIDSQGNFSYLTSGSAIIQKKELDESKEREILASTGGRITIKTILGNVPYNSINGSATVKISKREENEANGKISYIDVTNSPAFTNIKFEILDTEDKREGRKNVKYATKTSVVVFYEEQSQYYAGEYEVTVSFDGMSYTDTFTIYPSVVDYYAIAQRAQTDGEDKVIPSNSKTEWYAGIYLSDGSSNVIKRNKDNFAIKIYDRRADLDEKKEMYFYDLYNYQIIIVSKVGNNITYYPIINGESVGENPVTESYSSFSDKYSDAAKQINSGMIVFNSSGTVSSTDYAYFETSNHTLQIFRVYYDEVENIQKIEFALDGDSKTTMPLNEAIRLYDRLALLINNHLVQDENGYVIGNGVRGSYRKKVDERPELSDLFNISYNDFEGIDNEIKAISIVPKTEVSPGNYYVYIGYNSGNGVGDINNDPDSVIFDWNEWPQFWEQNIHMVVINYVEPDYSFTILPPELSNSKNNVKEIFNNVHGSAKFTLSFENTYDFENTISSKMYRCTTDRCEENRDTWTDVTNKFQFEYDLSEVNDEKNTPEQKFVYITANTVNENNENGTYIYEAVYKNSYGTASYSTTFVIKEACSGAYPTFIDDKDSIYNYFSDTLSVNIETQFLGKNANLVPMIETENGSIYTGDLATKTIKDSQNNVMFTFEYTILETEDNDIINYIYEIKNVAKALSAGNYNIYFTYLKNDKFVSSNKSQFSVLSPTPTIDMSLPDNDKFSFDDNYIYIEKNITANFIDVADLGSIAFTVMHFDSYEYVDISSATAYNKYATASVKWDDSTKTDSSISGVLYISLIRDKADLKAESADYLIQASYSTMTPSLMTLPAIKDMFTWEASKADLLITGAGDYTSDSGFPENLENVVINMYVKTPYKKNISWAITNSTACYDEYRGLGSSCNVNINFNGYFTANNTTGVDGNLTLNYTPKNSRLAIGSYFLVLYYDDSPNERLLFPIIVRQKSISIDFDQVLIYSESNDVTMDGLFQNKDGYIYLPVIIDGINPSETTVEFTDLNGSPLTNKPFTFDQTTYENKSILDIKYRPNYQVAEAKDYMVVVRANEDTNVYKSMTFTMHQSYFSYSLGTPTYNPVEGLVPNARDGGEALFSVNFEGLTSTDKLRSDLVNNTTITDGKGNDVTKKFNISTKNISSSGSLSFFLSISYNQASNVEPGVYTVNTSSIIAGYELEKNASFVIGNYNKSITIDDNIQIFSTTDDNRVHKNVSGTYRLSYSSAYDLSNGYISVKVTNSNGNDVTDKFRLEINSSYIDVVYKASPELESGNYMITVSYNEDGKATSSTKQVMLYPNFNMIVLSNLEKHTLPGNDLIYSDQDGQYYSFHVNTSGIKLTNYTLEIEILDSNNIDVTDEFKVVNAGNNYNINIQAFKNIVDQYSIRLYVLDEAGDKNYSNTLRFSIDANYYNVNLSDKSSISQIKNYNTDTTSIYDKDGAHILYEYSTNYPTSSDITVVLYRDGEIVKEFKNHYDNRFDFTTGELEIGTYQVSLCINGVTYATQQMKVIEYIQAQDIILTVNGKEITTTSFNADIGNSNISIRVVPTNPTESTIKVSTSNTAVLNANTTRLIMKEGTANMTISVGGIEKVYTVTAKQALSSSVFTIDNNAKTIYVHSRTTKEFTVSEFTRGISGLSSGYRITNSSGTTITGTLIGTGYKLVNGSNTYTFIVIGDVTGDGRIQINDVSMLFQHVLGKKKITDTYKLKAASIRKQSSVTAADVAKLYQYSIDKIKSL